MSAYLAKIILLYHHRTVFFSCLVAAKTQLASGLTVRIVSPTPTLYTTSELTTRLKLIVLCLLGNSIEVYFQKIPMCTKGTRRSAFLEDARKRERSRIFSEQEKQACWHVIRLSQHSARCYVAISQFLFQHFKNVCSRRNAGKVVSNSLFPTYATRALE
jgi:hypothetical protein